MVKKKWSTGSQWGRWDPHVHTPGTLRADGFGGDWHGYFTELENRKPEAIALGITDYSTLSGYKTFIVNRRGRAGHIQLVFPNVELRLATATKRGQGINIHLLVSPEQHDYLQRIEEVLGRLTFGYRGNRYPCTDDGLRRLGRAHSGKRLDDGAALRAGANQFKVELQDLKDALNDPWCRSQILVAVAAGNDGLGGLSKDAGLSALREDLAHFANIIFSGQPSDRKFWLEQHPSRPCLHGSDAHDLSHLLKPDLDRRCWIRGDATFESLRQVLVEPERRVFIGDEPPVATPAAQVIDHLTVTTSSIDPQTIAFNAGLVTVIGPRGSGKTALADILSAAAGAEDDPPGPASFIGKARRALGSPRLELHWRDGSRETTTLQPGPAPSSDPSVQYLSQQFVERLASPGDVSQSLIGEIERVVFEAIPEQDRMGAVSFEQLRDIKLASSRSAVEYEREIIRDQTAAVANEQLLEATVPNLTNKLKEFQRIRQGLDKEIAALPAVANRRKASELERVGKALQDLVEAIASSNRQAQSLSDLAAEMRRLQRLADDSWRAAKLQYGSIIDDKLWETLRPTIDPKGISQIDHLRLAQEKETKQLREQGLGRPRGTARQRKGLVQLQTDHKRLTEELGLDQSKTRRRAKLVQKLAKVKTDEAASERDLKRASGAATRAKEAQGIRLDAYQRVFDHLQTEQRLLELLYEPLRDMIAADARLHRLGFSVGRTVDIDKWAERGEQLFDLRTGPFPGHGTIKQVMVSELTPAWASGDAVAVRAAMEAFINKHLAGRKLALSTGSSYAEVGEWLFSTDHVSVGYSIEYDGVGIDTLSPGTKGVVLLTIYLGLDRADERPLIIDQPEENLDPSSVFTDLVPFFRDAARRRQIVMVTHNANLVVNTDSDQVIVATSARTSPTTLPAISYASGGLEDPTIRAAVCNLLEGGADAFRRRGERYGLPMGPA